MHAVTIQNVSKRFANSEPLKRLLLKEEKELTAVTGVSLEVDEHEIFGILGPNGCGKSTLIRILSTLLTPDEGDVIVLGIDVVARPQEVKPLINRVSVEANFFKSLSARENLLYAARLYGIDEKTADERIRAILSELAFPMEKLDEPLDKFSRGQQQKVAIARGFLSQPRLILLDEPTTGLDPKSKIDVQQFILKRKQQTTTIITSHDMEEVERLCDRIAIMDRGRIVAQGTADELKRSVQEKEVYTVVTSDNGAAMRALRGMESIQNLHEEGDHLRFATPDFGKAVHDITHELEARGIRLKDLRRTVPTLEDVFLALTGKKMREEET